ncbi:hypothetical protein Taro_054514 [Colocasia esculenta]|uniref:Uncharacterized protein n=1 Tax=Colocasia esculenta TaxID=4460 RepID=A0A843XQN2_COLES|nr:hypothetical protein [Colocasia esculenta]
MLKYSPPNPWGRVYILLGSCGGVLGGWGAGDRPHEAVLLPRPAQTIHLKSTKGADPVNATTR